MAGKILVLGSSNIYLIFQIPRFHGPGETIMGDSMLTVFGGKGANQAIAAKRLGGRVTFVTKLGDDHYGEIYRWYLIKYRIDRRGLLLDAKRTTGTALIEVIPRGENRIIVSAGANGFLSPRDLKRLTSLWQGIDVFVAQLEIPYSTVRIGLQMAKDRGARTLLNPSPPIRLPANILSLVDFIVPNESEAEFLSGIRMRTTGDLRRIGEKLLSMGPKNVVITLGPKGLFFKNGQEEIRMKAFPVRAIDTTAAGDAFMGALACGLSENRPIRDVLPFATAAGALTTTKLGAQPSLPSRREVEVFLSAVP